MNKIAMWSYTALTTFEKCKFQAFLRLVARIPQHSAPGSTASDRGIKIHNSAEQYLKGAVELAAPLAHFSAEFTKLRELTKQGKVSIEQNWCFDRDWNVVDKANAVGLVKLDSFVHLSPTNGVVIDFKTGKKHGNEVKHAMQGNVYQLAAFLRYPELQSVTVEFWYLDKNEITKKVHTRESGMRFFPNLNQRIDAMLNCEEFPPNPNPVTCKWCPYGPGGTKHCTEGYSL